MDSKKEKWVFSTDDEMFNTPFYSSKEEVIMAGKADLDEDFFIGRALEPNKEWLKNKSRVFDKDLVIENLTEYMPEELAEEWLCDIDEEELNEKIIKWLLKDNAFDSFVVDDIEIVRI